MQNWEKEIVQANEDRAFDLEKAICPELIGFNEFNEFMNEGGYEIVNPDILEKAGRDMSELIKKEVWVTRNGKSFRSTVYIRASDKEEQPTPIGGELSPEVKGLQIEKYSEKAVLIKGDTYANVELMRSIKKETGFGAWSSKLKGWVFSLTQIDTILGLIWNDIKDKDEDKAQAIQNQKNASLTTGDEVNVSGEKGKVEENVSTSEGTKYNVTMEDGTTLEGVDEKVIEVQPETDDKKISKIISNARPENRAKTEKQLFGIKPIENIHSYSLEDYMKLHGITEAEIQQAIKKLQPKEKTGDKKPSTSGSSSKPKKEGSELTKNQLISKLIYKHYQAVKQAIEAGQEVPDSALAYYPSLKEAYGKKRQAMSEETKRKISEALTKDKVEEEKAKEEMKKQVEEFFASMTEEEKSKLKESFSDAINKRVKEEQSKLSELILEKEENDKKYYELHSQSKETESYSDKNRLHEEARALNLRRKKLVKLVRSQSNVVSCIKNGGDLSSFSDKTGLKHDNIPDFTKIDSRNIYYDVDTILTEPRPKFIPEIDEEKFKQKGFILDAIRIDKDTYMVAVNEHSEIGDQWQVEGEKKKNVYDKDEAGYVILTLDQLVLTNDYYTTKQKGTYKAIANKRNQAQIDYWNKFSDDKKNIYYNQRGFYNGVPAAVKKKVSKEQWEGLSLQEKEKLYIPVKKYNPEKLKTVIEDGKMWSSFHEMHERFIDLDAKRYVKSTGRLLNLGEREAGTYGHPKVFASWNTFSEMLNWKLNDIKLQREEYSNTRKQALETSFGESNTNDLLYEKDGILVKRQNGEQISQKDIDQIENAWGGVQKSFGSLSENAKKDGLKLSHSGNTFIYASKAAGMYVPSMKTIAISNKFGEDQFGFTLGHETAHWLDNTLGEKIGKRFASDDYESTAGQIAIAFRKNLNKKTDSSYTNSTTECFARALEQYNAIETKGEMAEMAKQGRYFASEDYVNKETYESKVKPLIKQFLEENKTLLKSTLFDFIA